MSGASGDFAALALLEKRLQEVAAGSQEFRVGLLTACAAAAQDSLDESFISGIDPYGKAWAPVQRGGRPLTDTGRLASSWSRHLTPDGFTIETNVSYARTHQLGAGTSGSPIGPIRPVVAKRLAWKQRGGGWRTAMEVRIKRRQMVPQADTGGMGRWGDSINEAGEEFLRAFFGK